MKLVDQTGAQELSGDLDATDHLYCLVLRSVSRLIDRGRHAIGDEREREVLVLLRSSVRRMMGQHEDRDLELVAADVRVGIRHSKALLPITTAPVSSIRAFM